MHIQTSDQPKVTLGVGPYTCNWGLHMAGLYETERERDEIILGFLHQGDVDGDLLLYCPVERSPHDFIQAYGHKYPDCRYHPTDSGKFQLLSAKDLYYPNNVFSPWIVDTRLQTFFDNSRQTDPRHIRAAANMAWALETIPGAEHFMACESRLNYFVPGKPWINICLYNVSKFSGATIMHVLQTHPYTISDGIITENPYYEDPDIWLAKHAPEFLTRT